AGNAEGAVLIIEMNVDGVVAALRHSPRYAALPSIFDLSLHRRHVGLVEQGVFVGRHHQQRHQVFEHRSAPSEQDRVSTGGGQQTPEGKPAFLRQLSLCDGDEIAQSRFRCQQVVASLVGAKLGDVVADHQLTTYLVEKEVVVHGSKVGDLQR